MQVIAPGDCYMQQKNDTILPRCTIATIEEKIRSAIALRGRILVERAEEWGNLLSSLPLRHFGRLNPVHVSQTSVRFGTSMLRTQSRVFLPRPVSAKYPDLPYVEEVAKFN